MLNSDDMAFFAAHGYLRLPAFHAAARLADVRRKALDEIKRVIAASGPALRKLPTFQQIGKLSGLVKTSGIHEVLVTAPLVEAVRRLAGPGTLAMQETNWLLSPAHQGAWTLEGLNWHVDLANRDRLPGIQAFFLIDDVAPRGGATLALAGSHRPEFRRQRAAALRELLRTTDDLKRQLSGMDLQLIEMSGRAGDVFLMDMRVLHTPSVNAARKPRVMATCRWMTG